VNEDHGYGGGITCSEGGKICKDYNNVANTTFHKGSVKKTRLEKIAHMEDSSVKRCQEKKAKIPMD